VSVADRVKAAKDLPVSLVQIADAAASTDRLSLAVHRIVCCQHAARHRRSIPSNFDLGEYSYHIVPSVRRPLELERRYRLAGEGMGR